MNKILDKVAVKLIKWGFKLLDRSKSPTMTSVRVFVLINGKLYLTTRNISYAYLSLKNNVNEALVHEIEVASKQIGHEIRNVDVCGDLNEKR